MNNPNPTKPTEITKFSEAGLAAISAQGLGHLISLGGALGLSHYLEYRPTHDVDAWWSDTATASDRDKLVDILSKALRKFGEITTRAWGDVISIELSKDQKKIFCFQIAKRDARLSGPVESPWPGIGLDSLEDLIAGKMTALVERGAPRDFRDIFMVCRHNLTDIKECWKLWRRRQELAGSDQDMNRACLAVETHLTRISVQRPLEKIADPEQRTEAENLRLFYRKNRGR